MYINIRKSLVSKLPSRFQKRGVKLFPKVEFMIRAYTQTWKTDKSGEDYIMAKREPKWKYKVYACASYRENGKVRNQQILLETIYYWDIVDNYLNKEKKPTKVHIGFLGSECYNSPFDDSWLPLYIFEDMADELFMNIRKGFFDEETAGYKSVNGTICGLITDKLRSEIESIAEDYTTTLDYKTKSENVEVIAECTRQAEWLNKKNGFKKL